MIILRDTFLGKNLKNIHRQLQINNLYSNLNIHVHKIIVEKMVLNYYFKRSKSKHIFKGKKTTGKKRGAGLRF